MTTIIYKAGRLLADSNAITFAQNATHKYPTEKIRLTPCQRAWIGLSGNVPTSKEFETIACQVLRELIRLETLLPDEQYIPNPKLDMEQKLLVLTKTRAYYFLGAGEGFTPIREDDYLVIGSGINFATVALAHGMTARKALEFTMKLDPATSGPIQEVTRRPLKPLHRPARHA